MESENLGPPTNGLKYAERKTERHTNDKLNEIGMHAHGIQWWMNYLPKKTKLVNEFLGNIGIVKWLGISLLPICQVLNFWLAHSSPIPFRVWVGYIGRHVQWARLGPAKAYPGWPYLETQACVWLKADIGRKPLAQPWLTSTMSGLSPLI